MTFVENFNVDNFKDFSGKGELLRTGSRTFSWRLFLGLIPEEKNYVKWIQTIRKERANFYKRSEELRINKNKDLDPKLFNPLALNT
jgi:hypothetical protein